MIQIVLKTFLGLILTVGGLYLAYLFIKSLDTGGTPLLLLPSLLCIVVGMVFLSKAGSSNASVIKNIQGEIPSQADTKDTFTRVLQRNNEIQTQWERTAQLKDKLKVSQIAAEATESPE